MKPFAIAITRVSAAAMFACFAMAGVAGAQDAPPSFALNALAKPASVLHGRKTTIRAAITNEGGTLLKGVMDLEIYDANGAKVGQKFWLRQDVRSGHGRGYVWSFRAPDSAGTYTVKMGVFGKGWAPLYTWNDGAVTFTVR